MDIKALQSQFLGDILTPGSTKHETSRQIWSGMIDRGPAREVLRLSRLRGVVTTGQTHRTVAAESMRNALWVTVRIK